MAIGQGRDRIRVKGGVHERDLCKVDSLQEQTQPDVKGGQEYTKLVVACGRLEIGARRCCCSACTALVQKWELGNGAHYCAGETNDAQLGRANLWNAMHDRPVISEVAKKGLRQG